MPESTQQSTTCTEASRAPLHTVRETLRSVELPTAASPFGPVRKREQPPVKIPGPRKPSDSIGPRPAPPKQTLTARPLPRDLYDTHHADLAFGAA